jgi:hypothetical protein
MADLDAYKPPKANIDAPTGGVPARPCPKCGNTQATKVGFTWWGGALGPKLFSVVKCRQCRVQYNGKTGASLTGVIIVYQLIALVVFGGIAFWWFVWGRLH